MPDRTATDKLSLDELFTMQSRPTSRFTIAQVENTDRVKITPWVADGGCLCRLAFELAKDAIDHVVPTGNVHACCGKVFQVVEVHFKQDYSVPITEVLAQFERSAMEHHEHHEHYANTSTTSSPRLADFCNPCGSCGIGYQWCWSSHYNRWDCFSCDYS